MKKTAVTLFIEHQDHNKIVLSRINGDTFSSKNEELIDFLHKTDRSQASELPSDDEIETYEHDVTNKYGESMSNHQTDDGFAAWEIGMKQMRSIASPILASHVARIKELEEEIKQLKLADKVKCDCDENTCCYYCEFEKAGTRNLTMPKD